MEEMFTPPSWPPVRNCCGRRHEGLVCDDGKVMCCLCFNRFSVTDLSETDDGCKENVCKGCRAEELHRERVR